MIEGFNQFYLFIDPWLIPLYRMTGIPMADYMIGTFCISLVAVLLGEVTVSVALRLNKPYIRGLSDRILVKESMAGAAYQKGDMAGYKALNKEATDAWGRKFFAMIAHSAAILWPVPFTLGWMQMRFAGVEFPVTFPLTLATESVGFTFSFFPIYILCRMVFGRLRPHLPYFSWVHKSLVETASLKA